METLHTITVEDAKAHLDKLVADASRGEEWLITDPAGKPIAKLAPAPSVPAASNQRWKAFGLLKGQIEFLPGYDEPLDELEPYTE